MGSVSFRLQFDVLLGSVGCVVYLGVSDLVVYLECGERFLRGLKFSVHVGFGV